MRASAILLCIRRKSRIPERRPLAPVRRIVPPGLIGSNSITSTPEQRLFLASQKLAVRVSDRARVVRDYVVGSGFHWLPSSIAITFDKRFASATHWSKISAHRNQFRWKASSTDPRPWQHETKGRRKFILNDVYFLNCNQHFGNFKSQQFPSAVW